LPLSSKSRFFRGPTAFKYGSIILGEAINLVTMTGYDTDQFRVRLEDGGYGYLRGQVSFGGVDLFDYVGSVMARSRDGFREHNRENTERLFGDVGYKFSDHLENRFYVILDRQLPGGLTRQELNDNPRRANPDAFTEDFN
jgi:iron complex outermembrane receptor protein